MLDLGWSELFVIGVIALVVIGPRELPGALRSLGRIIARARGLAQDFRDGLDDIARETDVKNIAENSISDFYDDKNDEWMDAVNAGKLDKNQTPLDGEDAAKGENADTAEAPIDDADEAAFDEAEAAARSHAETTAKSKGSPA